MHIHFLVEESSTEIALKFIVPKIIGNIHTFEIHNFGNKNNLLKKLPKRMKAYANFIPDDWRIVILVDEDRANCLELKNKLCDASSVVTLKLKKFLKCVFLLVQMAQVKPLFLTYSVF